MEVFPAAEDEDTEIAVRPEDVKYDFFRSSGPGGQNVQKVASAVRLTHVPTGIVISCQNERSQHQNREFAMRILKARLLALQNEEKAREAARLRGERPAAEWGNQIRSYVLHPYKSVKDHRTDFQSTNPDAVLGRQPERLYRSLPAVQGGRERIRARDPAPPACGKFAAARLAVAEDVAHPGPLGSHVTPVFVVYRRFHRHPLHDVQVEPGQANHLGRVVG